MKLPNYFRPRSAVFGKCTTRHFPRFPDKSDCIARTVKRETPFCSTIPDFFIIVAVSHRNTIVINIEIKVQ